MLTRLSREEADEVAALAASAQATDGADPLNEEARFALGDTSAEHHLHRAGDELAGYLVWQPQHRTAQLVVHPRHRRRGIGSALLSHLAQQRDWGVWAFGDLPAAQEFAAHHQLVPVRGLLIMERSLTRREGDTAPRADLSNAGARVSPGQAITSGLTLRAYRPEDAAELLAVNAAAFAHHPEQGALDAAGLSARMAEAWFDPDGLILGFDDQGLAGFHWTKRVSPELGEVYVMAVAPRTQGRGYGRALLNAGLAHLAGTGAGRVLLYVDAADQVAVRMYESAGFRATHRDLLYAPERRDHDHG